MIPVRLYVAYKITLAFSLCSVLMLSCGEAPITAPSIFTYIEPAYENISLETTDDSLIFPLDEHSYNAIRSFNYFTSDGLQLIAFYDRGSKSILIYNFTDQLLVRRVNLKQWINDTKLDKASVFIQDFENIFVTTKSTLYLLDSTGTVKTSINYFKDTDKMGYFDNNKPIVMTDSLIYTGVRPVIKETSLPAHKKWRTLYGFDMKQGTKQLLYPLPETYHKGLFGYPYMEYGFCINDKGFFVFSFAADTNIYETNLIDYHKAYYGKSKYITGAIAPITDMELLENGDRYKHYSLYGSYGPIFFDPYKKRYLRQAKHKISEEQYLSKTYRKKKSIIIFNDQFKIIGESVVEDNFSFSSIFFTPDGNIYARTNTSDEQSLHFRRLAYQEKGDSDVKIAKHEIPISKP